MAKRRRLKKKVKRFLWLFFITITICIAIKVLPFSHALELPTKYDDQFIDGIAFTDIKYLNNTLSYCHHTVLEKDVKNNKYVFSIKDNNIDITTLDSKTCDSITLEEKPENIKIIEISNNTESVLSSAVKEKTFNKCIESNDFPYENSEELIKSIKSLNSYLAKTDTAVYYENLNDNFTYGYNETKVFYGASLIKLPEALYLIDEAINGNISLDDKVTLGSSYYSMGNSELRSNKVGSKVEIGKLIKYMLETSDNGAHLLLFDTYAGKYLTDYEKSIGSPYPYQKGSDKYGYQTAEATNVYLKRAYEIITTDKEYGPLLKQYMVNTYYNNLDLKDGIEVAHKYGLISSNPKIHDIGIVFNDHPYTISVLTYYSSSKGGKFINNVHKKVKAMHELYYVEKTSYCLNEAYFNN